MHVKTKYKILKILRITKLNYEEWIIEKLAEYSVAKMEMNYKK